MINLPGNFTDVEELISCLTKGGQLNFTPDFIRINSSDALECANKARIRYDKIGDGSYGFSNVFVKEMKKRLPKIKEDPEQLLALQYTGYEKDGKLKWKMGSLRNVCEVFNYLVKDENEIFPKKTKNIIEIHKNVIKRKNGDKQYTFHSITNEEFIKFSSDLINIKNNMYQGVSIRKPVFF